MSKPRRLAYFGGTFDPPHLGHLVVAGDVVDALELDALFFLPARIPPHKRNEDVSPAEVRLEMLKAALTDDPRLGVSDLEMVRPGPSFTVDTLEELVERMPADDLHFVIGTDQLAELDLWKKPERVARLARLVVITRGGRDRSGSPPDTVESSPDTGETPPDTVESPPDTGESSPDIVESPVDIPFDVVPVTRIDLSSTEIRNRVRAGRSIRYLVPEPVRRIIERESLYQ